MPLRHREGHIDGRKGVDADDGRGIGTAHHVALVHLETAHAAADGRAQGAVGKIEGGAFHRGLVGLHGGTQGRGLGGGLFVGLTAHIAVAHQLAVTARIIGGLVQLGLGLGQLALLFAQGGFKRTRIDGQQHIAFLHVLAFRKMHLFYLAGHTGGEPHAGGSLDVAHSAEHARHVLRLYRHHMHGRGLSAALSVLVSGTGGQHGGEQEQEDGKMFHGSPHDFLNDASKTLHTRHIASRKQMEALPGSACPPCLPGRTAAPGQLTFPPVRA